ncbi:MAG: hypothetical protein IPK16_11190 [Anaerolineales bacterium]|nr:hypothetical protein [Anaerolineales bacterium]
MGRVTLDFESKLAQPAWNEAKTVCVLLLGELYGMTRVRQRLVEAGHRFATDVDAELIVHLYEDCGDNFVDHLNGCFAGAIWQPHSEELILFNDPIGSRSLFYALVGDRVLFSSGVRALLAEPSLPRARDPVAIAQMLQFEYMLDSRTYLAAVKVLAPATVMHCCKGEVTASRRYCRLVHTPLQQFLPEAELLERLYAHLATAFERQAPGALPAGINLSGGLDSRMVMALWLQFAGDAPMQTFTFGAPGADDVHLAAELASISHSAHTSVLLRPDFVQRWRTNASGAPTG